MTILEASPKASGGLAGGWRTAGGRAVEAGIHGFWREYRNTFDAIEKIGLRVDDVLSDYSPSVLYSRRGKVATAPVLGAPPPPRSSGAGAVARLAALVPPPLDTALLADFAPGSVLNAADRASAVGLLAAWADFGQEDDASWARYDAIDAETLFKDRGGVSANLYDELVAPMLHVLPMAPGDDVSAAAALSCFHVFALQTRGAFDVKWCAGGISEKIFAPWQDQLEGRGVAIAGGSRVESIARGDDGTFEVAVQGGAARRADAVVFAVGGVSAAKLSAASPGLLGDENLAALRGVTCVAARLWLKPSPETTGLRGGRHGATRAPRRVADAMRDSPVAVVGPGVLPELAETGFCVYDLDRMHDEQQAADDTCCLEVDFYRAGDVADLDDEGVADVALRAVAGALGLARPLDAADLVDVAVVRARDAVSHFDVGSAAASPPTRLGPGVYAAGDYVDRSGHASWSTEKAVVTGRQCAAALAADLGLAGVEAEIEPAARDTAQLAALRAAARALRSLPNFPELPPPAPWASLSRR